MLARALLLMAPLLFPAFLSLVFVPIGGGSAEASLANAYNLEAQVLADTPNAPGESASQRPSESCPKPDVPATAGRPAA